MDARAAVKYTVGPRHVADDRDRTDRPVTILPGQLPDGANPDPRASRPQFYTVEARRFAGYDTRLPGEAVIIHSVLPGRSSPAWVVDPDNNGNVNDAGAMWLPGETFTDAANGITVTINAMNASSFNVTIVKAGTSPPRITTQPRVRRSRPARRRR